MDRGAWCATVHGLAKSQTRLSNEAYPHMKGYRVTVFSWTWPSDSSSLGKGRGRASPGLSEAFWFSPESPQQTGWSPNVTGITDIMSLLCVLLEVCGLTREILLFKKSSKKKNYHRWQICCKQLCIILRKEETMITWRHNSYHLSIIFKHFQPWNCYSSAKEISLWHLGKNVT